MTDEIMPTMATELVPWSNDYDYQKAQRIADLVSMRRTGATFEEIATHFDISSRWARKLFYDELKKIPAVEIALLRQEMTDRFDSYRSMAFKVLQHRHYTISTKGEVVRNPDAPELLMEDDKPTIEALHLLMSIDKEEMRLWGLAAPQQVQVDATTVVQYEIKGVDPAAALE
jgi:AraC-like DNA-binding protein